MRSGEECLLHTSCFTHITHTHTQTEIVILELTYNYNDKIGFMDQMYPIIKK